MTSPPFLIPSNYEPLQNGTSAPHKTLLTPDRVKAIAAILVLTFLFTYLNQSITRNAVSSTRSSFHRNYSGEARGESTTAARATQPVTTDRPVEEDVTSEEQMRKKNESYMYQEMLIAEGNDALEDVDTVKAVNRDPLPPRTFSGDAVTMCSSQEAGCVDAHAFIRPLIVTSPNHHLASCVIQKSMSTVMSALLCFLTRPDDFIAQGRSLLREYPDVRLCGNENEYPTFKTMRRALHIDDGELNKWRFTMITRDPVDRFLSGFIDRCIRVGDSCFGCGRNMTCFMIAEHKRMLQYAFSDRNNLTLPKLTMEDIHVFPQNWRCDMKVYGEKFQFLKYSNDAKDGLLDQIVSVLRESKVSEKTISFIEDSLANGRTAHSTVKAAVRTYLERRIQTSPFLKELITKMFYYDYKYLGYSIPTL